MQRQIDIRDEHGLLMRGDTPLGFILLGNGRAYTPDGPVSVTPEAARLHNETLTQALLLGLDEAKVGQWGTFYHVGENVQTWTGTHVAKVTSETKTTLRFRRPNGHLFLGYKQKDADSFNFKRIA